MWGVDDDDHDRHLEALLERVEKSGLQLNREKCKFGFDSVSYVGYGIFTLLCTVIFTLLCTEGLLMTLSSFYGIYFSLMSTTGF